MIGTLISVILGVVSLFILGVVGLFSLMLLLPITVFFIRYMLVILPYAFIIAGLLFIVSGNLFGFLLMLPGLLIFADADGGGGSGDPRRVLRE